MASGSARPVDRAAKRSGRCCSGTRVARPSTRGTGVRTQVRRECANCDCAQEQRLRVSRWVRQVGPRAPDTQLCFFPQSHRPWQSYVHERSATLLGLAGPHALLTACGRSVRSDADASARLTRCSHSGFQPSFPGTPPSFPPPEALSAGSSAIHPARDGPRSEHIEHVEQTQRMQRMRLSARRVLA